MSLVKAALFAVLVSGCALEISEMPAAQPQSGRISFTGVLAKAPQERQSDSTALLSSWRSKEAGAIVAMKEPMSELATKGNRLLSLQDFLGFGYIYDVCPGDCNYFSSELFSLENGHFLSENEYNVVSTASNTRVMAMGPASALDSECSIINTSYGVVFSCTTPEQAVDQKDIVVADTGPVQGTAGGGIAFSHIMSSVNFVSSANVPQCHIDSISITSVDLYGEYSFTGGWGALSQQGTVTVISDIDIEEDQAGVPVHESDQAPMLIPQTLGSDSKLILYVSKADEHFVLQCPLDGLQLTQGDVVTLALDFDVKGKVLKVIVGTGTVDLSSYIADGYKWMDFFLVNGGNGGAGGSKVVDRTTGRTSGSGGSGGYGGNCLTVRDVSLESEACALTVTIGDGGKGGTGGLTPGRGDTGGITKVEYNDAIYQPTGNDGSSCSANNPFNPNDKKKYGVSGTRGGSEAGTTDSNYGAGGGGGLSKSNPNSTGTWNNWLTGTGGNGKAGVVIVCIRCGN